MKDSKLISLSFIQALGVIIYTLIIAWVLSNAENVFGKFSDVWGPFIFLLLFVISAAIVGLLIFAKPVFLYLDSLKKEAIKMLALTIGWIFLGTVVSLLIYIWAS